jgi:hypothetical protein
MSKQIQGRVTEGKLQVWVDDNRPELALYETDAGVKGFYRRDTGPAHGFHGCGQRWADVAATLGAVEVKED